MRKTVSLTVSLMTLFVACSSDVDPTGSLYRTWRLVQTQVGNRTPQSITSSERITISFLPNGRIMYDRNGRDGACCVPRRFDRNGQVLLVDGSVDQPEYCNYADIFCTDEYAYGSGEWTVIQVNDDKLVLQIGDKLLTHQSFP